MSKIFGLSPWHVAWACSERLRGILPGLYVFTYFDAFGIAEWAFFLSSKALMSVALDAGTSASVYNIVGRDFDYPSALKSTFIKSASLLLISLGIAACGASVFVPVLLAAYFDVANNAAIKLIPLRWTRRELAIFSCSTTALIILCVICGHFYFKGIDLSFLKWLYAFVGILSFILWGLMALVESRSNSIGDHVSDRAVNGLAFHWDFFLINLLSTSVVQLPKQLLYFTECYLTLAIVQLADYAITPFASYTGLIKQRYCEDYFRRSISQAAKVAGPLVLPRSSLSLLAVGCLGFVVLVTLRVPDYGVLDVGGFLLLGASTVLPVLAARYGCVFASSNVRNFQRLIAAWEFFTVSALLIIFQYLNQAGLDFIHYAVVAFAVRCTSFVLSKRLAGLIHG